MSAVCNVCHGYLLVMVQGETVSECGLMIILEILTYSTIKNLKRFSFSWHFPLFPPLKGFPCKTSPGFRNGWTTWSGRSGHRVDTSTCAASTSQKTALIFDGASATWRTQPSQPFSLPRRTYVSVFFFPFLDNPSQFQHEVRACRTSETLLWASLLVFMQTFAHFN